MHSEKVFSRAHTQAPFNCTKLYMVATLGFSPPLVLHRRLDLSPSFSSPLFFSLLLTQVAHTALNTLLFLLSSFCLKSHFPFIFVFSECDSVGHTHILCSSSVSD